MVTCTSFFISLLLPPYQLSCSTPLILKTNFTSLSRRLSRFKIAPLAMSRATDTVEHDFFGMERKESSNYKHQFNKFPRQRSFRDIQCAISKINPEIIKSVIASGSANPSISIPSTPKDEPITFPALSLYRQIPMSSSENVSETSPLTIFYNGTVAVFDLSIEKAECILKLAVEGNSKGFESKGANVASDQQQKLLETLNTGDLPIARRESLQRFLEKRKERSTSVSPYSRQT